MLLLYQGDRFNANFFRRAGLEVDHSFYLESGGGRTLLVPQMNEWYAEDLFQGEVLTYRRNPVRKLEKLLQGKKVEADLRSLPASVYAKISSFCRPEDASRRLARERMRKTSHEVGLIAEASEAARELMRAHLDSFGKSESSVRGSLLSETYLKGLSPAFEPIVSSGAATSYPHSIPSAEKIHGLLLLDYGVRKDHYCSDLTRVYFEGRNGEQRKVYEFLQSVVGELVERLPEFETARELSMHAESLFRKEGVHLPPHSFGHGIGLEVHEFPIISRHSRDSLEGCTFTLEPAAYFPGRYGLRYEEVIHYDGKKGRIL